MKKSDLYSNAHLFVAAIRVLEHTHNRPPSIDAVCDKLSFSLERGNLIARKLKDMKIIDIIEGAFGTKLFIKNHLELENIPKDSHQSSMEEELKKFQNSKKDFTKKIESLQAEQKDRKKNLFAELERRFAKESDIKQEPDENTET